MTYTYTHTGNCPRCGAPVFAVLDVPSAAGIEFGRDVETPVAHFTCECRLSLPTIPPGELGTDPESTEIGDRKHLARHRKAPEPEGAERAD